MGECLPYLLGGTVPPALPSPHSVRTALVHSALTCCRVSGSLAFSSPIANPSLVSWEPITGGHPAGESCMPSEKEEKLEDPWGLHVDTGPEASVSHPASFLSICASSRDPWHGLSSRPWGCGTGCSPAWNPSPRVLSLHRPCPTVLHHSPPAAHADPSLKERVVLLAEIFQLARQVAPNVGLDESSLRPLPIETIKNAEATRWLPERLVRTAEEIPGGANETAHDPGDGPAADSSADTGAVTDGVTGWSVDIPGVTRLTGHAQRRRGTGPQDVPFCGLGHKGKHIAVPWKLCRNETVTVYSIPNSTHSLWDWSPDSERNPGKESNRQFAARIWNLGGTLVYQTEVWKLLAAFETSGSFMQTGEKVKGGLFWNATWRYPRACVPYPFMIIAGSVNLTKNNSQYYIHCFNCTLTNCIRGIRNNSGVLIVKQPPFVMLPVNLTEPWYEESGLELWERVRTALARPRRGIGLIILGVVTLITLIASAVTASVSLAQSVHTASIVDDLAKNTSKALGIQEDIDRKLEDRLNALYDAVRFLGEEVQGLKLRTKIRCHANYCWICVTAKIYNDTETPWDRVKSHLDGIWHNENISLDLLQLHQEILDIENAPRASMDLAENAEEFVNSLFSNFPSITSLWHLFSGVVTMLLVLALFVCIAPCIIKKFVKELWDIKAVLHSNYLRQKNQREGQSEGAKLSVAWAQAAGRGQGTRRGGGAGPPLTAAPTPGGPGDMRQDPSLDSQVSAAAFARWARCRRQLYAGAWQVAAAPSPKGPGWSPRAGVCQGPGRWDAEAPSPRPVVWAPEGCGPGKPGSAGTPCRPAPRVPCLESCLSPQRHLPAGREGSGGTDPRPPGRDGYLAEAGARRSTGLVLTLERAMRAWF
ncbi:uncharacterized protein LOC122708577 [Cervus elaphus]|uniref:uncharacterized protein LOC122708577 n=1 Tax=Cervus elaphus TaxID=9860 RepID=UPI001CC28926|nr:uncharacterized protein LOC122708577 [Cervus elaphus]